MKRQREWKGKAFFSCIFALIVSLFNCQRAAQAAGLAAAEGGQMAAGNGNLKTILIVAFVLLLSLAGIFNLYHTGDTTVIHKKGEGEVKEKEEDSK